MGKIQKFTDLKAWQEAHQLVVGMYKETEIFPTNEQFGLTNQIRRAAVSISSNIAEGFSRQTRADKSRFYVMAQGSTTELQSQLILARDIGYLSREKFDVLASRSVTVHKLLTGLIKSIKES